MNQDELATIARACGRMIKEVAQSLTRRIEAIETRNGHAPSISSVEIRQEAKEREYRLITRMSDGTSIDGKPFRIESLIYREIYSAQHSYDKGDAVTHDGSLWICLEPTKEVPGKSTSWRLAVKRGRDGKDIAK